MSIHKFLNDEGGGYTIWSLTWFSLYVAMGGLAVDVTDAYRNQTLLQSTADASALAAVMSLPDESDAAAQALAYSTDNLNPAINGNVLNNAEVIFGDWNFTTRAFTEGGVTPNAVRVVTRRDAANANPLATNFLRIIGLQQWNISVESIAVQYVPDCLTDGFVTDSTIDMGSGSTFSNGICVHSQSNDFDPATSNSFDPSVSVSMPDLDSLPNLQDLINQNPAGLEEAFAEGDLWPQDADNVDNIIAGLDALNPEYLPDYMVNIATDGTRTTAAGVTKVTGNILPPILVPNTVYVLNCGSQYSLPGVVMSQIVIVADCQIDNLPGLQMSDVVLASSYDSGGSAINIAAQSTLGDPDFCAAGGGVELYSPGDIRIADQGDLHGLRIVSGAGFIIATNGVGSYGMSVQAKNEIDLGSQNDFGLCSGGVPGQFATQYRLVQ